MKKPRFFLFGFSFVFQLIWFLWLTKANINWIYAFDSAGYLQLAQNLQQFGVFSISQNPEFLFPEFNRTIGYPSILAIFYQFQMPLFWLCMLQILAISSSVIVVYELMKLLFKNEIKAFLISLLVALDLPFAFASHKILTESFFAFSTLLFAYFFIKFITNERLLHLLISVFFVSAAMLIKPLAMLFPIAAIVLILIKFPRKKWAFSLVLIASYISIAPKIWHNHHTTSEAFYSNILPINLLFFNTAYVESAANDIDFTTWQLEQQHYISANFDLKNAQEVAAFNDYAKSKFWVSFTNHPLLHCRLLAKNFVWFFFHPTYNEWKNLVYSPLAFLLMIWQLLLNSLLVIGLILYFFGKNNFTSPAIFLLLILFTVCFASLFTFTENRFRIPVIPIVYIFGLNYWISVSINKLKIE